MLMMRPHLRRFMPGTAARVVWKADVRLMAMMASHCSMGNSSTGATCWMPALLTRMSTAPKSFSHLAIMSAIWLWRSMLAGSKATRVPSFFTSAMAFSLSFSLPSPLTTMLQPARASASAMPWPMPEVDPVTTAVLPWRDMELAPVRSLCVAVFQPSCSKADRLPTAAIAAGPPRHMARDWLERGWSRSAGALRARLGNTREMCDDAGSQARRHGARLAAGAQAGRHLCSLQARRQHALPLGPGAAARRRQLRHRQGRARRDHRAGAGGGQAGRPRPAGGGQGGGRRALPHRGAQGAGDGQRHTGVRRPAQGDQRLLRPVRRRA